MMVAKIQTWPRVHGPRGRRLPRPLAGLMCWAMLAVGAPSFAQVQIAQVDPSRLLTRQNVDVYVSVTDPEGHPIRDLPPSDFALAEGRPGGKLLPVGSFTFHEGVDPRAGVTFFLLVDNSGSMYAERVGGIASQTRIEAARSAIRTFLNSVTNPADRIGLATFNTYYRPRALPGQARAPVEAAIERMTRPAPADAFTELYASLESAARDLAGWKGRKVIILLTDGENFPYYLRTGRPSPQFGTRIVTSDQAISELVRQGISVFPIHFGPAEEDVNLRMIARRTGGRLFEALDEPELARVYLDVRSRVLSEYRLGYAPRMISGSRRLVSVDYRGPGGPASAEQVYFVGTLFGGGGGRLSPLLLIPLAVALLGWIALTRMRFLNGRREPNLEVLGSGRTRVFPLTDEKTVVRVGAGDEVTVAADRDAPADGSPDDITIVQDPVTGIFTVESKEPIMVNNRPRRRRELEPGDVLRVGDVTVVFDAEQEKRTRAPAGRRDPADKPDEAKPLERR